MTTLIKFLKQKERHAFHLVDPSQLPIITSFAVFIFVTNIIYYLYKTKCIIVNNIDNLTFQLGLFQLIGVLFSWFVTVVYESGQGYHTRIVRQGLRLGMVLFIVSEVMFFFAFFWAFFHVSLAPAISLGCIWPPKSIQNLDVWGLPLVNTLLLLTSGLYLTISHRFLLRDHTYTDIRLSERALVMTLAMGLSFLFCQWIEYKYGIAFSISETVYGSTFFVTTGFHGLHVTIGTIFLLFCLIRSLLTTVFIQNIMNYFIRTIFNYMSNFSYRKEQHVGFEAAAWYWHFVDVVWIFLFITVYWWGS